MTDQAQLRQFKWFDDPALPATYLTKTQLGKLGLLPGEPVGFIYNRRRKETYYLYDRNQAQPRPGPTPAQAAALAAAQLARKTCQACGEVQGSYLTGDRMCKTCLAEYYREHRRIMVLEVRRQAQAWLDDCLILDIETTGLVPQYAEPMHIGIIDQAGNVLFDRLIKPRHEPEPGAVKVHGITMAMVENAPGLADVLPELANIIAGKTIVIYNKDFDYGVLKHSLQRRKIDGKAWLDFATWHDMMNPYAVWYGEWSEYRQSYKWQPLCGDHTAIGDCRRALALLHQMADPKYPYGWFDSFEI